ncbi:MAG: CRTAC1 family protein, partial [Actinomycetota bacterium]
GWSAGCGFADYDRDGDLDLFVSRYVKVDLANLPEFGKGKTCEYRGIAVQCGPRGLPGEGDLLFRNDGDLAGAGVPFPIPWLHITLLVAATAVASLAATAWPARQAARIKPAVALRIAD